MTRFGHDQIKFFGYDPSQTMAQKKISVMNQALISEPDQ
jgi:hypothetical protein